MLTLITPTVNRPHLFSLLENYIAAQHCKEALQWLVVSDGDLSQYDFTMGQEVINRKPGGVSMCENYRAALPHVRGDKIFCIEDDDAYLPGYLSLMSRSLNVAPLVGMQHARYYHVAAKRYRIMPNLTYSSLASTCFTREVLPVFEQGLKLNNIYVDGWLWTHWGQTLQKPYLLHSCQLHVGMKGLDKAGLGEGHDPSKGEPDQDGEVLKHWLGEFAKYYS